ncbi:MAG: ribosome-associated translation inhibitor RaiA [Leptospiraceae bacterium]|nr:ribosome-associated translation inhibitor RaiA [Leptospiraceae bacterium]MCK6381213.1 ribosome-associated translation inhibitor RaiA [Leptospiraceae bacterium]NUM42563.1 ribosome-associated translation inhibitor RaiA [Leptospiraceae bacterium]
MKINYTWKHVDRSESAEEYADKKFQVITKFTHKIISCDVSFELSHGTIHANLKLHSDGTVFNAQNSEKDIYACIDGLESKIHRQLEKFHDKKSSH